MSGQWQASALSVVRGGYGVALLLASGRVIRFVTGRDADPRTRGVARVLGVRHLAQAVVTGVRPHPLLIALGAEVDVAHAASMLGLATVARSHRRSGAVDGAIAMTFAAVGAALTRGLVTWTPSQTGRGPVGWLCSVRDAVVAPVARRTLPAAVRRALPRPASPSCPCGQAGATER